MATQKTSPAKEAKAPRKKSRTPLLAADKPLTDQQIAFCHFYAVHRNATKAAIEAKYSPKTATMQASRLLTIVKVQTLVAELIEQAAKKVDVTVERVIREMGALAFSDARNLFDDEGRLKPIKELDDMTAAAIASVEVDTLFERSGKDRVAVGTTTKVKLWDKNSAAEKLMRHLGMFEKDNKQKTDPVSELLALIHGRNTRLPIKE